MEDVEHTNGHSQEKPAARPLAIHTYAAFSDGVIRGIWVDFNNKIVHIENTALTQVPRDMMQILDPKVLGTVQTSDEKGLPLVESNIQPDETTPVAEDARRQENARREKRPR
ncbi:MAG: hypothetical protein J2P17_33035 [Mycobacterium sp.]|nr:hypothetical protein [Mycobacterium sp.]